MATDPFLADTPNVIKQSHRQVFRCRATHPDFDAGAIELDASDVSLSWDEERAPRVEGSITAKLPETNTEINLLDPRTGVRIEFDCGYVRPGGDEDVWTIADLGLRSIDVNLPDDTMTLECASDEMLVIDGSPTAVQTLSAASVSAGVIALINQVMSPKPRIVSTVTGAAVSVDPVYDRWATMQDLLDGIDAKVYDDGLRTFYIQATPTLSGTPIHTLVVGQDGTILKSRNRTDREAWFNYVYLRYQWKNSLGVDQTPVKATALVTSGSYAVTGPAGKRIFNEDREIPTTQALANAAAASILKRQLSRSKSYSLTAIAAYWLRPGHTVSVTLPDTDPTLHLVKRVSFNPIEGTMDIDTRLPDNSTIDTTTPSGGGSTSDPTPPAVQTYISTWESNNSETYRGDGTARTDTTDLVQGYNSYNGNGRGIALFTSANSTGDETSVSITTALSGATISKIEVYLYANHWYSYAGGTARLGYYNGTTIPSTFSGGSPYVTSAKWPINSGRWVNITSTALKSALKAGTARGITVGPGVGTDLQYYGRFNGHTGSNKPKLRITYSK